MTSTPRIDTLTNRVTATRRLLDLLEPELRDLHVLAYDRYTARREVLVKGGEKDYGLDTHGDLRARDAYRRFGDALEEACDLLAEAAHDAYTVLRQRSEHQRVGRRTIAVEELAAAIESQARRAARAEYTPVRTEPQPEAEQAARVVDRLRRERDQARQEAERLLKRLARYEDPEPVSTGRRRRRR